VLTVHKDIFLETFFATASSITHRGETLQLFSVYQDVYTKLCPSKAHKISPFHLKTQLHTYE
jgi:hypothetical protein